jgi:hypothetical protein
VIDGTYSSDQYLIMQRFLTEISNDISSACLSSIFGFVILVQKFDMLFYYWFRVDTFSGMNSDVTCGMLM